MAMKVSVKIVDAATNLPIKNVSIYWTSSHSQHNGTGLANGNGISLIGSFNKGEVLEVTATKEGFGFIKKNFTVQFNSTLQQILTLTLSSIIKIVLSCNENPTRSGSIKIYQIKTELKYILN